MPIAEMKYSDLTKVMLEFFLSVCKDSGDEYPFGSIQNFHKSFNCILRNAQRIWIAKTKIVEESISSKTNFFFLKVNSAVVAAMKKSHDAGVNLE